MSGVTLYLGFGAGFFGADSGQERGDCGCAPLTGCIQLLAHHLGNTWWSSVMSVWSGCGPKTWEVVIGALTLSRATDWAG